jgi:hypothetical protein
MTIVNGPTVTVTEQVNKVVVSTPGPQGPAGRTILNGTAAPASNLGFTGDFYYNTATRQFYGPKLLDGSWDGVTIIIIGGEIAFESSWTINQMTGPVDGLYSIVIDHNLGFKPNATVKNTAGDVLETGIDYNSSNQITLRMSTPFSGTAHLS